jgi:signal transduction histidine kinase
MERSTARLPSPGDTGIAAAFLVVMLGEFAFGAGELHGSRSGAVAMSVVMAGAVAFRRRYPVTSYAVGSAALAAQAAFFFLGGLYPYVNVAHIYSVGAFADRRRAVLALPVGFAGIVVYFSVAGYRSWPLPVLVAGIWILTWAAGYRIARAQEEVAAARRREALAAAAAERTTIARELHDLVGHTMNVMVVQAGAGRRILDTDPERARQALASIEESGRVALDELDWLLGLLRPDVPADLAPQPGLDGLPELFERFGAAGITVDHVVAGDRTPLPRALDLSAFRIVQEALTNALKHSGAARATVTIRYREDDVELEVADEGSAHTGDTYREGRGLIGIAERVAVFGGHVRHGRTDGGGFRVLATLPLP